MSPAAIAIVLQLVVLHRADGSEVVINPAHVVALHSAASGQPNKVVTDAARCAIGLSSGKFIGVLENCAVVRKLLEDAGSPRP